MSTRQLFRRAIANARPDTEPAAACISVPYVCAGSQKYGVGIMVKTKGHQSAFWTWLPWTIGGLAILGLGIFFADGVPALIAPWFAPKP
jgi:hypothetical protein